MANPWESDSCDEVRAHYTFYPVPHAAALWCGVPAEMIDTVLSQASMIARNIFNHPQIACLEPRCRVLHDAINNSKLPCGRDGRGRWLESEEHVAQERRTISHHDLKEWVAQEFPTDKPDFLFDEIERETHSAINAESFRALQADRDALERKLESSRQTIQRLELEKHEATAKVKQYEAQGQSLDAGIDPRSEKTYLNVIGALLEVVTGTFKDETFSSETQLREFIAEKFDDLRGVRPRTTADIFASAKRALTGDMD